MDLFKIFAQTSEISVLVFVCLADKYKCRWHYHLDPILQLLYLKKQERWIHVGSMLDRPNIDPTLYPCVVFAGTFAYSISISSCSRFVCLTVTRKTSSRMLLSTIRLCIPAGELSTPLDLTRHSNIHNIWRYIYHHQPYSPRGNTMWHTVCYEICSLWYYVYCH